MTGSLLPGPLAREHPVLAAAQRDGGPPSSDSDDAYLLRLCLDLKLDVLLLTLGAAATDPACQWPPPAPGEGEPQAPDAGPPAAPPIADPPIADPPIDLTSLALAKDDDQSDPPWERWLREDVDAVHALARELLAWGGCLPSSMSGGRTSSSALAVLERLEAFHLQLRELLVEVEVLRGNGAQPTVPRGVTSASSTSEQAVARHCRRRLAELQRYRIELAELLAAQAAAAGTPGHPGEFLG
jgi:hypothetical protein